MPVYTVRPDNLLPITSQGTTVRYSTLLTLRSNVVNTLNTKRGGGVSNRTGGHTITKNTYICWQAPGIGLIFDVLMFFVLERRRTRHSQCHIKQAYSHLNAAAGQKRIQQNTINTLHSCPPPISTLSSVWDGAGGTGGGRIQCKSMPHRPSLSFTRLSLLARPPASLAFRPPLPPSRLCSRVQITGVRTLHLYRF